MRELEVRLALVCFGGASLAVYMNGVSHEVLKLVRASKVYHSLTAEEKADPSVLYNDRAPDRGYSTDTESNYFDLLRMTGETVDLRVIVDVISGASAGGINGIFLARALAYDLDFDPLRDMWMNLSDIEELMERETLAERWSKIYMYPLIWLFGKRIWTGEHPYAEAKRKLSRFVRSRWFEPPFSGTRMLKWMIDANHNMGEAKPGNSLLPTDHQLDLFVSLTNFYGQSQLVSMHDPKTIREKQHKVSLKFSHMQGRRSARHSDFDDDNIPGLGFAARATSSFPGAFPPMRLADLKAYLKTNGASWHHEAHFMAKNFDHLSEDGADVERMSFIDGGVTNNKPFADAIDAVIDRPAHREVDRRIIFVDPRPETPAEAPPETQPDQPGDNQPKQSEDVNFKPIPGFFHTILSSLAEIPRDEPILGDLQDIEEQNRRARRFEIILKRIEQDVAKLVDQILILAPEQKVSTAMLASWRERAHEQARHEAGYGYGSYAEAKAVHSLERISSFLQEWQRHRKKTDKGLRPESVPNLSQLSQWANEKGFIETNDPGCRQVIPFFRKYDVDYRVRRMRFLIKRLNRQLEQEPKQASLQAFSTLKAHIYDSIARYRQRWQPEFYKDVPLGGGTEELMDTVANTMSLEDLDFHEDEMLAEAINAIDDEDTRRALFHAYVGFSFYDVLTLPMTTHTDLMEIDEIRVDRISPIDCTGLHCPESGQQLMGAKLFNFGAFFSRRARENDYIWGRIHAANRLVDFVTDAAGAPGLKDGVEATQLRRKLALSIIESEAKHTLESEELIAQLKKDFALQ